MKWATKVLILLASILGRTHANELGLEAEIKFLKEAIAELQQKNSALENKIDSRLVDAAAAIGPVWDCYKTQAELYKITDRWAKISGLFNSYWYFV